MKPSHLLPEANRVALAALANEAANPREAFNSSPPLKKAASFKQGRLRKGLPNHHFFKSSYLKFRGFFLPNSTQLSHLPPQAKKVVKFPGIPNPCTGKNTHPFFPPNGETAIPGHIGTWAFCSKSRGFARRPFFLEESHPNLTVFPGSGWINGLGFLWVIFQLGK